jgi:XTP/dITP diphosphohydrolase
VTGKQPLCFATNNQHKLLEVAHLLPDNFKLVGLNEIGFQGELAEDFLTLEENSRQKAEYVFKNFHIPSFADDTGLEVDALNGEPGVFSARFAGPQRNSADNMNLLLKKLTGISNRQAQFRTVITLIQNSTAIHQFEGIVRGEIIFQQRGIEGFGYDPIFVPSGFSKTLAEMTLEDKNKISHRAVAVNKLVAYLREGKH